MLKIKKIRGQKYNTNIKCIHEKIVKTVAFDSFSTEFLNDQLKKQGINKLDRSKTP